MYQFDLKISKINEKVNTILTSHVTLTSYFDVAITKRNAGQRSIFCVWLFSCNDSVVSGWQKTLSETKCYLSTTIECLTYLSTLKSAQRITVSIFL